MKKMIAFTLALLLVMSTLAACAGTTVVVQQPTTPKDPAANNGAETPDDGDTLLKTGLAVFTKVSDSTSAADGEEGAIKYDVTIAAVTVDGKGVIHAARIDSVPATVKFDANGSITSDLTAAIATKNELGDDYGMVAYGGAVAEWDDQVAALCDYAVGKTVEELRSGAIDESGKAPEGSDLASSATIYLGGYVGAIEAAVNNARHLGANAGDQLALVCVSSLGKSTSVTEEKEGNAQLYTTIAAVTSRDGVITSCLIDAVQANVAFDATGTITSDLSAPIVTKNELGENYGMKAYGGAIAEWYEQAASFAAYITGKTADEVAGIAVDEKTAPTDADLTASVTIKIGDFKTLIAKALS